MRRRTKQRGFSLITVTLLVAVVTISSLVLLEVITEDQVLLGSERRAREARETAEGGTMEAINDYGFSASLPDPDVSNLSADYEPGGDSLFSGRRADGVDSEYQARVRLVRTSPVLESSLSRVQAVVYDLEVDSTAAGSSASTQAQVYKVASNKPGIILRPRHAH